MWVLWICRKEQKANNKQSKCLQTHWLHNEEWVNKKILLHGDTFEHVWQKYNKIESAHRLKRAQPWITSNFKHPTNVEKIKCGHWSKEIYTEGIPFLCYFLFFGQTINSQSTSTNHSHLFGSSPFLFLNLETTVSEVPKVEKLGIFTGLGSLKKSYSYKRKSGWFKEEKNKQLLEPLLRILWKCTLIWSTQR